jgi:hypothetical protein
MRTSEPSSQSQRRPRFFVATTLAVLAIAAASYGLRSRVALAEPESALPPQATAPTTPQLVPTPTANGDTDVGPGQAEPVLVGAP